MINDISAIIKSMLALKGKSVIDLSKYFGLTRQSMNNRFARGAFDIEDLLKVAEFLDIKFNCNFEVDGNTFSFIKKVNEGECESDIAAVIKSLLALKGKTVKDLADYFGILRQSMSNRLVRKAFDMYDLIKVAKFLNIKFNCNFEVDGNTFNFIDNRKVGDNE